MRERFEDLARRIAKSQLISYSFEDKRLRFQLFHPGSSRLVSFELRTDTLHARSISAEPRRLDCSIELIELGRRLDIRHDRYFPPTEAKLLLIDARDRVTLAYGRRCTEYHWLLNLQGEYPLLSCLVYDLEEIRWEVE